MADRDAFQKVSMLYGFRSLLLLIGIHYSFTMIHSQRTDDLLTPANISCVYVDFKKITCSWSLEEENGNKNFNYSLSADESVVVCYDINTSPCCGCNSTSSCLKSASTMYSWQYISHRASEWLTVRVQLSNRKNVKQIATCRQMKLTDIVKPSPIKMSLATDSSKTGCAFVYWHQHLIYRHYCILTTNSSCKRTSQDLYLDKRLTSYPTKICELQPNEITFIILRCRILVMGAANGLWSDPSTTLISSQTDVPYSFPNTTDGLYEITGSVRQRLLIRYYFTPLNNCELHDSPDNVIYCITGDMKRFCARHPNYTIETDIPNVDLSNITFFAINSAGESRRKKHIKIYSQALAPTPSDVNITSMVQGNESMVNVTVYTIDKTFKYIYHTFVYCKFDKSSCKEPLKWFTLSTQEHHITIVHDNALHRYGLITHVYNETSHHVISTGIHWDTSTESELRTNVDDVESKKFKYKIGIYFISGVIALAIVVSLICFLFHRIKKTRESYQAPTPANESTSSFDTNIDEIGERERLLPSEQTKTKDESPLQSFSENPDIDETLLHGDELPKDVYLQSVCKFHGRKSESLKCICENICKIIKRNIYILDENATICPAWKPFYNKIVFVVESEILTEIPTSLETDLELILNHCKAISEKESRTIMKKEKEILKSLSDDEFEDLKQLQQYLSENSRMLTDKHKNITAIFPSVVKSVGYRTSDPHELTKTHCVSIHVDKKCSELLPLDAEPIPRHFGSYPIDIVQGKSIFFGKGPQDYHDILKIGVAIHANVKNDEGDVLAGSLGCFVQHQIHGLCCLTSAHVVFSKQELKTFGFPDDKNHIGRPVYQPIGVKSSKFGNVVAAAYNKGYANLPGNEVALIKIDRRHPRSGSFPQADSDLMPNFEYNSGNIVDASLLKPSTEVFKYGMVTGQTVGSLGMPVIDVRYEEGVLIRNQLVVLPNDEAFAVQGDSWASVFIGFAKPGTEAVIGMVTGGDDSGGRVYVAPIHDVLAAVNCPPYLHRFEDSGISLSMEEDMDCSPVPSSD